MNFTKPFLCLLWIGESKFKNIRKEKRKDKETRM